MKFASSSHQDFRTIRSRADLIFSFLEMAANIETGNPANDSLQLDAKRPEIENIEQKGNEEPDLDESALEEANEKLRRVREARAQALTLELLGDLPHAEVKPPEHVLFVCKLNPVTEGLSIRCIYILGRPKLRSS